MTDLLHAFLDFVAGYAFELGTEAEKFVDVIGVPIKADVDGVFSRSVRIDSMEDIYKKLSPYVLKMLREFNNDEGEAAKARRLRMVAHRKARVAG